MINSDINQYHDYSGNLVFSDNTTINTYEAIIPANYTNTMHVDDNMIVEFSNGYKIKGAELGICIKMLHRLAKEEYPEEFL